MSYTADSLANLMVAELASTGVALGLTDASAGVTDAVAQVALILGDEIADLSDDLKTSTVARWRAWVAAENAATNQYELGSDGSYLKRQMWWQQIRSRRLDAEALASRYSEVQAVLAGSGGVAVVTSVYDAGSPYSWPSSSEWE